jgi:hypothetical protein
MAKYINKLEDMVRIEIHPLRIVRNTLASNYIMLDDIINRSNKLVQKMK